MLTYGLPGLGGAILALLLAALATRGAVRMGAALLVMAFIPALASLALSATVAPVFIPRTLVAASVPLIVLLGLGAVAAGRIGALVFALLLVQTAINEYRIQQLPPQQDWYGALDWLKPRLKPGDRIYAYPNEGALPLHYALREKAIAIPVRPIPEAVPSHDPTGWYPTGSRGVVSLPQYRLEQIAGDATSSATPTIWLVRLGPGKYDRGDGFVRALSKGRRVIGVWPAREPGKPRGEPLDIIGLSVQPAPRQQPQP